MPPKFRQIYSMVLANFSLSLTIPGGSTDGCAGIEGWLAPKSNLFGWCFYCVFVSIARSKTRETSTAQAPLYNATNVSHWDHLGPPKRPIGLFVCRWAELLQSHRLILIHWSFFHGNALDGLKKTGTSAAAKRAGHFRRSVEMQLYLAGGSATAKRPIVWSHNEVRCHNSSHIAAETSNAELACLAMVSQIAMLLEGFFPREKDMVRNSRPYSQFHQRWPHCR